MEHTQLGRFVETLFTPQVLAALGWLFYLQATYYIIVRARSSLILMVRQWCADRQLTRTIEKDLENDLGHAIHMLVMGHHLHPLISVSNQAVDSVLLTGWLWFTLRSVTWGTKVARNVPWYDAAHAGVFMGMYMMGKSMPGQCVIVTAQLIFWSWLTQLYIKEALHDSWHGRISDIAHADMGVVMLLMVFFPATLMSSAHHATSAVNSLAHSSSAMSEGELRQLIFDLNKSTVVFVKGGCRDCATGAQILAQVEKQLCSTMLRFVIIDKDRSPAICQQLDVTKCPIVLVVNKGAISTGSLENITDEQRLASFIIDQLK